MEAGKIVEWLVANGAMVTEGQPLYLLESDKSLQEIEAPVSGTLKITAAAGQEYAVGTALGEIG